MTSSESHQRKRVATRDLHLQAYYQPMRIKAEIDAYTTENEVVNVCMCMHMHNMFSKNPIISH